MEHRNWIDLAQDGDTGIETIRAHFQGHAYDPHWHDSYLVGVTEQGVQQFNCRRRRNVSTPGQVFLLEPGEIHDGHAPTEEGFTYSTLYLDPHWIEREMHALFEDAPAGCQPSFADTLAHDPTLAHATLQAFNALHGKEVRMLRQAAIDNLLAKMTGHLHWRLCQPQDPRLPGWRCARGTTCTRTWTRRSAWTTWPASPASTASASPVPSRPPSAWPRTPT